MSEERVVALIRTHLARYPQMQLADIYKLLHQAAFGPGHLIASKKAAREWLEHEAGRVSSADRRWWKRPPRRADRACTCARTWPRRRSAAAGSARALG